MTISAESPSYDMQDDRKRKAGTEPPPETKGGELVMDNRRLMNTVKRNLIFMTAAGLMAAYALGQTFTAHASPSDSQDSSADPALISVTGTAQTQIAPDYAEITYAVTTQENTAAECQAKNDESVTKTLELLKKLGIDEKSVATDFSMSPTYDWDSSDNRITGYQADTTITVSDVSVDGLGDILGSSVVAGVNSVSGVRYYSSQFDKAYNDALKDAMKMARGKAQVLAEAEGCDEIKAKTVSESGYSDDERYAVQSKELYAAAAEDTSAQADSSVTVSPGQITVEAQVSVTYAMVQ